MPVELSDEARNRVLTSIKAFFLDERGEEIGSVAADAVLTFLLEEVGPSIYNQGVRDARERMQARLLDIDADLHEEEFRYSARHGRP